MAISEEAKKRLLEAKQTVTNPTESQSGFSASTQERLQAYKEWGAPILQEMDDTRRAGYEERKALGIDFTAGDSESGKAKYEAAKAGKIATPQSSNQQSTFWDVLDSDEAPNLAPDASLGAKIAKGLWQFGHYSAGSNADTSLPSGLQADVIQAKQNDPERTLEIGRLSDNDRNEFYRQYDIDPEYAEEWAKKKIAETKANEAESMKAWAEKHPLWGNVASLAPLNTVGADIMDVFTDVYAGANHYDPFDPLTPTGISQTMREGAKAGSWFGQSAVGQFVDDVIYSSLQSQWSNVVGGGAFEGTGMSSLPLAFYSASAEARTLLQQGYDKREASILATGYGIISFITEAIGSDRIFDKAFKNTAMGEGFKQFGRRLGSVILKSMASEGVEEGAEDIADWVLEGIVSIINGTDHRTFSEHKANRLEEGRTDAEATALAIWDMFLEFNEDVLAGALSGGLMAGSSTAFAQTGELARNTTTAYQHDKKGTKGELVSNIKGIAEASGSNYADNIQATDSKFLKKFAENLKIGEAMSRANRDIYVGAIQDRLEQLGIPLEESRAKAEAIYRNAMGGTLSSKEKTLVNDELSKRVLGEIDDRAGWVYNAYATMSRVSDADTPKLTPEGAVAKMQMEQDKVRETYNSLKPLSEEDYLSLARKYKDEQAISTNAKPPMQGGTNPMDIRSNSSERASQYGAQLLGGVRLANEGDREISEEDMWNSLSPNVGISTESLAAAFAKRKEEVSLNRYANAVDLAYNYGKAGMKLADVVRNIGFSMDSALSEAYKNGQESYVKGLQNNKLRIDRKTANVSYISNEEASKMGVDTVDIASLSDDQNAYIDALDTISKAYGVKMVLFESSGNTNIENGHYDPTTNSIYIDVSSTSGLRKYAMLSTASHELVHDFRRVTPEVFDALRQFVIDKYYDGSETKFNEAAKRIMQQRKLQGFELASPDDAVEELVAMSCEKVFDDPNMISRLAETLESKTTPDGQTMLDKFIEWINGLIERLKSALAKLTGIKANPYAEEMSTKDLEHLRDLFVQAAKEIQGQGTEVGNDIVKAEPTDKMNVNTEAKAVENRTGLDGASLPLDGTLKDGDDHAKKYSVRSSIEAVGFGYEEYFDNGVKKLRMTYNGETISVPTAGLSTKGFIDAYKNKILSLINDNEGSPLNRLFAEAIDETMTKVEIEKIKDIYATYLATVQLYADDIDMGKEKLDAIWKWAGTDQFKAIKANSDKQYKVSNDMSSVCVKTEAVLNDISDYQVKSHRGVTPAEVMRIYFFRGSRGYQTPCPFCYVFSHWIRMGQLFETAAAAEDFYKDRLTEKGINDLDYWKAEYKKQAEWAEKNKTLINKAKNDIADIPDIVDEFCSLLPAARAQGNKTAEKKIVDTIDTLNERYVQAFNVVAQSDFKGWIGSCILKIPNDGGVDEATTYGDYKIVDRDILFDLRRVDELVREYPAMARFRTSKGSAGGKAVENYADNKFGEVISGIASNASATAVNALLDDPKGFAKQFVKAQENAKKQMLRGGNRLFSWSDNRQDTGPDMLLNFIQLQAIGAGVQAYTKQIEGLELVAAMGGYINGSLVAKGKGYEVVNGKEQLVFSDRQGINADTTFELNKRYDRAGNILVGMNYNHIRIAMADDRIFFIIPWHRSSLSNRLLNRMMELVGESYIADDTIDKPTDYTAYQEEISFSKHLNGSHEEEKAVASSIVKFWQSLENNNTGLNLGKAIVDGKVVDVKAGGNNVSESQYAYRELRAKVLAGKALTDTEETLVSNDYFLSQIRREMSDVGIDSWGIDDIDFIYPYEYWDHNSTIETADRNGLLYLEYCRRLGVAPKFSGFDKTGKANPNARFYNLPGYWKTLPDRRMYDREGNYQGVTQVKANKFLLDLITNEGLAERKEEYAKIGLKYETSKRADSKLSEEIYNTVNADMKFYGSKTGEREIGKFKSQQEDLDDYRKLSSGKPIKDYYTEGKNTAMNQTLANLEGTLGVKAKTRPGKSEHAAYEEATKHSTKSDAEYLELAKNPEKNLTRLNEMVRQAAQNAGYTSPMLYHGTTNFGFTKIDTKHSDDNISFFATDNPRMAKAYSNISELKSIAGETSDAEYDNVAEAVEYEATKTAYKVADKLSAMYGIHEQWNGDSMESSLRAIALKHRGEPDAFVNADIDIYEWIEENVIDYFYDSYVENPYRDGETLEIEDWADSEEGQEVYDAVAPLEEAFSLVADPMRAKNNFGNYSLYANLSGLAEFDAQGAQWNRLADAIGVAQTTRDLAQWCKMHGYKGYVLKNVVDYGMFRDFTDDEPATVYVFLDPTAQVKSADPVTYDDNGNVIPLSERFNSQANDIRYSTKENPVDLSDDNELNNRIKGVYGAQRYKKVAEYIVEQLGREITLSDGTHAIVNHSDASHVAHRSLDKKTRAIARIKQLVDTARWVAYEESTKPEFDWFKYYEAYVKFGNEVYPLYLNVGRKVNPKGEYHLYDITETLRKSAHRLNGVERVPNGTGALKADYLDKIISQSESDVNRDVENVYNYERKFSVKETNPRTLKFLNDQIKKGEYFVTFRAMQKIGDGLYSPMNADEETVDGKPALGFKSTLGEWERSTEDPSKVNDKGQYPLKPGKYGTSKSRTIWAVYNPYMHSSNSVLNDQFEAAYDRDNLVVVKCYVPKSEVGGAYHAEKAHDATGWKDWKSGVVATKLAKANKNFKRQVFLSRWIKPVEIVPDSEVARMIKGYVNGTDVKIPFNVVPPHLLKALEKAKVPINYEGTKIYQKQNNNPVKFSTKDSEGRTLTPEQREYFKDSKVRDENGNLLVVYHGSERFFTKFSGGKAGNFFSRRFDVAAGYASGVTEWNIWNPAKAESFENLWAYLKSNGVSLEKRNGKYIITEYDGETTTLDDLTELTHYVTDEYLKSDFDNDVVYQVYLNITNPFVLDCQGEYWDNLPDNASGKNLTDEVAKWAKNQGYDGVIFKNIADGVETDDVYVTFDASQQKDVENKNPTSNPDIRYSVKERNEAYLKLAENPEENAEVLNAMVRNAARRAGYNSPKLYHGTKSFGFTKFDLNRMDDNMSIFATTSLENANSYASPYLEDEPRIREVGRKSEYSASAIAQMTSDELLKEANNTDLFGIGEVGTFEYVPVDSAQAEAEAQNARDYLEGLAHYVGNAEALRAWTRLNFATDKDSMKWAFDQYREAVWSSVPSYPEWFGNENKYNGVWAAYFRGIESKVEGRKYRLARGSGNTNINDEKIRKGLMERYGSGIYALYGVTNDMFKIDADGSMWNEIRGDDIGKFDYVDTRQIAEYALDNDYNGVIIKNVYDTGSGEDILSDVYIYFDPASLKSADPVTYDQDGNIIPLSERFNPLSKDIRYSTKDEDTVPYGGKAYLTPERVDTYLKDFAIPDRPNRSQGWIARMSPKNFWRGTSNIDTYLWLREDAQPLDADKLKAERQPVFLDVDLDSDGKPTAVTGHEGRHRSMAMANEGIYQAPVLLFDYGNWTDNRKEYSSLMLRGQGKNPLDYDVWVYDAIPLDYAHRDAIVEMFATPTKEEQLRERYGIRKTLQYSLKEDLSPNEYLASAVLDNIRKPEDRAGLEEYLNRHKELYQETTKLSNEITDLENKLHDSTVLSDSDRESIENRIKTLRKEVRENEKKMWDIVSKPRMQRIIEQQRATIQEYEEEMAKAEEKSDKKIAELRARMDTNVRAEIDKRIAMRKRMLEQQSTQRSRYYYLPRIEKVSKELRKNLEKAPMPFREPIADFLAALDTRTLDAQGNIKDNKSNARKTNLIAALNNMSRIAGTTEEWLNKYNVDFNPEMVTWIDDMVEYLSSNRRLLDYYGDINLNTLSADMLEGVYKMVRSLNTTLKNLTKSYTNKALDISEEAKAVMEFDGNLSHGAADANMAEKIFRWKNAQATTVYQRMGDGGWKMYKLLVKGQSKLAFNEQEIVDFARSHWRPSDVRNWNKPKNAVAVEISGEKVMMTPAQMMALYATSRDADGLRHLLEGGGFKLLKQSSGNKMVVDVARHMTEMDLTNVINALNEYDPKLIKLTEEIQDFIGKTGAEWGNEVSVARFGYEQFGIENYFPLHTVAADKVGTVTRDDADAGKFWSMLNRSFTKERTFKANNALVIDGIFDIFANHMSQMALYNAYALPVLDTARFMNWEVNESINGKPRVTTLGEVWDKAFGKGEMRNYLTNLLDSIAGAKRMDAFEAFALAGLRLHNRVAVAANFRVAAQQPFSITRAFDELDPKYFAKVPKNIKALQEEMWKNSGIALWKHQGNYDTNIKGSLTSQVMGAETGFGQFQDDLSEKAMWLAEKGDDFTWALIWNACKAYVSETQPTLTDKAYMDAVVSKFEDVVLLTQVVDTPLQKSEWMREKSFWFKMTSSFKSEPTTSYNMLLRQFDRLSEAKQSGKTGAVWAVVKGPMLRAFATYALTSLVNAMVTAVIDAARDDDDYETLLEKLKFAFIGDYRGKNAWQWITEFMGSNVGDSINPIKSLPWFSDIFSLAEGYDADRADLTIFEEILTQGKAIWQAITKGDMTYKKVFKLVDGLSKVLGIPFANVLRDVSAVWNTVFGRIDSTVKLQISPESKQSGYNAFYYAIQNGESAKAMQIVDEIYSNEITSKTAYTGVTNVIREAYKDGKIDKEDALDYMLMTNDYFDRGFDRAHIKNQVDGWKQE